ncbi:histone-like transcription factor domain containing protein, putative [Babesia bigemina]|uniref:Histone-like transcription factor domain containing protein, putative n=1 Tax=Babesia bigemina TaxID=5866 RepID=A0A061DDF1_BABBI|nr:histone-like transcription factor domain containing protein, putative [Babesia bigemina]CDR96225.1 histone-like transcription factor domain containing protein, putative [Babesia bigemina]|eukprot:XP_012768411.1 histone-like transcription factor domain containing protein, putative [Babesia bigemina]
MTPICGNVSGDGYDHTDPMLAARSYEELLISASKAPGEAYENTIKSASSPDLSKRRDNLSSSFTYVSVEHAQGSQAHDAINARAVNDNVENTDIAANTMVSYSYTSDAPRKYSVQNLDTMRPEGTPSGSFRKSDSTARSSAYMSRPAATSCNDTQIPFSYEPTAYASHSGVEYDSGSQGDVSFAAFERRDVENDLTLPIANIGRVMKSVLPATAKIAKQAKDVIRDCVIEFILFVSSEASDICTHERRKTLSADDILVAMSSLGFGHYNDALRCYQAKIKEREPATMFDF